MNKVEEAMELLSEAMTTLVSSLESNPVIKDGLSGSTIDGSVDGKRYVTITSSGIQPEGLMISGIFFSPEAALESAKLHLLVVRQDEG